MLKYIKSFLLPRNIIKEITNDYALDALYPDGSCNRCKHYKPIASRFAITTFQIATHNKVIASEIRVKYADYIISYIEPMPMQHNRWSPYRIILSLRKVEKQEFTTCTTPSFIKVTCVSRPE